MTIKIALDDDLVGAAPQHRASPPTLAPVHFIAETDGKLAQINLPLEGFKLHILARQEHFSLPIALFFLLFHGDHWPSTTAAAAAWCANSAGRT